MDISKSDVRFEQTRSGGPGGQHANRRATAVRLRIKVDELPLEEREKKFVREHLPPRHLTESGEIIIENAEHRSTEENRKSALEVLNKQVEKAISRGRRQEKQEKRKKRINSSGGGGGGGSENIHEKQKKRRRSETTDDLLEQAYREDPDLLENN